MPSARRRCPGAVCAVAIAGASTSCAFTIEPRNAEAAAQETLRGTGLVCAQQAWKEVVRGGISTVSVARKRCLPTGGVSVCDVIVADPRRPQL